MHRRQPLLKIAFNIADFALTTTVALVVYDVLLSGTDPLAPRAWWAVFAATLAAATLNVTMIGAVMTITEGRADLTKMTQVNVFGLVVAAANTALGLAGVLVVRTEPAAAALLAVIAGTLLIAYRAYAAERRHHESLEFLYESTRALAQNRELGGAVVTLLENARTAFRCSIGELILLPPDDVDGAARTRVSAGEEPCVMEPVPYQPTDPVWQLLLRSWDSSVVEVSDADPAMAAYLETLGVRDAMITKLEGEDRAVGLLVVGGRLSDVTPFNHSDLRLFETVAGHAALSLENDQLETSVTKLLELERQLSHQAFHDGLTGLANRHQFRRYLDEVIDDRRLVSSVVLFIDLDDFKTVNDTLGHAVGDELLRVVAERLLDTLRTEDVVARLGGDEFAVLLQPDGRDAEIVARRIIAELHRPIQVDTNQVRVSCSIGIAVVDDAATSDELIRNADTAMYEAKAQGKGRCHRFTAQLYAAVHERHTLQSKIDLAIERDEFEVHFQPVVGLDDERVVGAEALIRWRSPDGGCCRPASFIDFAEQTGQSVAIGRFVIARAIQEGARLVEGCGPEFQVAVNVSGRQLSQSDVAADIEEALAAAGLAPERLVVEITETAMMADIDANVDRLLGLRAMGVQLALDDFGTGYSSLSHLRTFPIDLLKVAKPFVDGSGSAEDSERDAHFLRVIIELGHVLGMKVIGEGVETPAQAQLLRELGCEFAQGFLYATALPLDEFIVRYGQHPAKEISGFLDVEGRRSHSVR